MSPVEISDNLKGKGHIPTAITINNRGVITDLKVDFHSAANILVSQMFTIAPTADDKETLSFAFIKVLIMQGLPLPSILESNQDGMAPAPDGIGNFLMEFDL